MTNYMIIYGDSPIQRNLAIEFTGKVLYINLEVEAHFIDGRKIGQKSVNILTLD